MCGDTAAGTHEDFQMLTLEPSTTGVGNLRPRDHMWPIRIFYPARKTLS